MKAGERVADRFEIERLAGTGAMGLVYRARDLVTSETVALKLLRPGAQLGRFVREVRLLAELRHPGIVRYIGHGEVDEGPYLAMEWLDGETLAERLKREELNPSLAVRVVEKVALAAGTAHRRWIVHRDLKPSNVFLVDKDPEQVKLLDFGVARHGAMDSELTQTGVVVGSPRYMSPEQLSANRDVDVRADVWALGVILFRCLSGRHPFADAPSEILMAEVLSADAPALATLRPDLPAELSGLVARMLSRDPNGRPDNGSEVAAALANMALPGLSAPPSRRADRPALTLAEQRLTCLVFVQQPSPELQEQLAALAQEYGAQLDGAEKLDLCLRIDRRGTASDLAARAGRCALALRERSPELRAALVMGVDLEQTSTLRSQAEQLLVALQGPGIAVDATGKALLEGRFDLDVANPSAARLLKERAQSQPLRRLLGRLSPCVGRERELAFLESLYDECAEESRSRAILVTGAPGVGKSRLRYELLSRLAQREPPPRIWIGRGDPLSAGAPFGVLSGALRQGLALPVGPSEQSDLSERLRQWIAEDEVETLATSLGEMFGMASTGTTTGGALRRDLVVLGDQMQVAFETLIAGVCAQGPLILVLEDLHWGDWPTVRFVGAALSQLVDRPLMVLALARPDVLDAFPRLWTDRHLEHIALRELGSRAGQSLVRAMLGDSIDDERVQIVVERSMGNAFFLEELIRAVAERPNERALPPTVLAMAQSRVDTLDAEARHVLRAASVFGQVFWSSGIAHLAGERVSTGEWLGVLTERELITRRRASRFSDDTEYVFRHALIRDAAYSMLTEDDRRLGHRLAAEWLMAQGENDAFILAEHLHRGGEDARAAPWYRRAAEQALEGNDFTSALAHTGRALSCGLPPPAAGEALLIQASAAFWSGDLETHERAAQSAMRYFPTRSSRWYAAALEAARTASRLGRHEALTPLVERVLGDNRRGTVKERTMLMARIAVPVLRAGDTVLAGRIFERLAQDEAQAVTNPIARAWLERLHGFRGLVNGDRAVYLEHTSRAVEYFERAGDQRNALTFLTSVGFANIALGRHDQAAQVLKRALAGAQRLGLETARLVALHNLSIALAMAGDAESGIRLQREVLEAAQRGGDRWIQCVAMTSLADLLLRSDNAEEALHHARRASELSDRPHRAVALSLMARAELALGRPGDALTAAEAAHNLLDELGGIEDGEAGVRLALIDALLATGHKERAVELLRRAKDRIMEQAARLPTAELRRTFLREVPDHADTLTRAGNQGV